MGPIIQFLHQNSSAIGAAANIMLAVGAFVAGVSAAIAAFQLRATWKIYESQYNWWTRSTALQYSISRNDAYRLARREVEAAFGVVINRQSAVSMDEFESACSKRPQIDDDLRTLLSNYENLALAIRAKVADDDVAFELLSASVLKTVEIFLPYIEHRRVELPSRYLNLLWLRDKWERRDPRSAVNYSLYFDRNRKYRLVS